MSISIRIVNGCHPFPRFGVIKQVGSLFEDPILIRTDQFDGACLHGFGAFCFVAKDKNGLTERRSFFLDTT